MQVAGGGYDVAWKDPVRGLYTVWSTDSNGNYLSNLIGAVAGNSTALESFETIFNQDLNGDGIIGIYVAPGTTLQVTSPLPSAVGAATIGAGATLELGTANSSSITFSSSTGMLKLDSLTAFTGVIIISPETAAYPDRIRSISKASISIPSTTAIPTAF